MVRQLNPKENSTLSDLGSSVSQLDITLQLAITAKGGSGDLINAGIVARQLDQADFPNVDINRICRALVTP